MKIRSKISDYSPLFGDLLRGSERLRIVDRQENGESFSVLTLFGVKVVGSRHILEKVREGLLRNGGPQRISI